MYEFEVFKLTPVNAPMNTVPIKLEKGNRIKSDLEETLKKIDNLKHEVWFILFIDDGDDSLVRERRYFFYLYSFNCFYIFYLSDHCEEYFNVLFWLIVFNRLLFNYFLDR